MIKVSWSWAFMSLTMESEYIAAADAANEAVCLRKFVIELGVFPNAQDPMNSIATTQVPLLTRRNQGLTLLPNIYSDASM